MQAAILLKKKSQATRKPVKHAPSSDLKLSLSIKVESGVEGANDSVHFKRDGGRFDNDKTLKLTQDTKYTLTATLTPSTSIQ